MSACKIEGCNAEPYVRYSTPFGCFLFCENHAEAVMREFRMSGEAHHAGREQPAQPTVAKLMEAAAVGSAFDPPAHWESVPSA